MVDLTKLGREELIEEFEVIISEWEQCLKNMNSLKAEISDLKDQQKKAEYAIEKGINFNKRSAKCYKTNAKIKKIEKKFGRFFQNVFPCFVGIISLISIMRSIFHIIHGNYIQLFIGIIKFFLIVIGIPCIGIPLLFAQFSERVTKKHDELYEERRVLIEQSSEIKNIKNKIENLENKIKILNANFQEFRRKRNNLSHKYLGYENRFKDYLESGRAHNLKEAIETLENDLHRQEMLNIQRNTNAKILNMNSDLSQQLLQQSQQLSQQSAQIADLQQTINYLEN